MGLRRPDIPDAEIIQLPQNQQDIPEAEIIGTKQDEIEVPDAVIISSPQDNKNIPEAEIIEDTGSNILSSKQSQLNLQRELLQRNPRGQSGTLTRGEKIAMQGAVADPLFRFAGWIENISGGKYGTKYISDEMFRWKESLNVPNMTFGEQLTAAASGIPIYFIPPFGAVRAAQALKLSARLAQLTGVATGIIENSIFTNGKVYSETLRKRGATKEEAEQLATDATIVSAAANAASFGLGFLRPFGNAPQTLRQKVGDFALSTGLETAEEVISEDIEKRAESGEGMTMEEALKTAAITGIISPFVKGASDIVSSVDTTATTTQTGPDITPTTGDTQNVKTVPSLDQEVIVGSGLLDQQLNALRTAEAESLKQDIIAKEETKGDSVAEIMHRFVDKFHDIYKLSNEQRREGKRLLDRDIIADDNPILDIENWIYSGAEQTNYTRMINNLGNRLRKANISLEELHLYLNAKEAVAAPEVAFKTEEDGNLQMDVPEMRELRRTRGQTADSAKLELKALESRLGPEKMAFLEQFQKDFWQARQGIIKKVIDSGAYDQALIDKIAGNEFYVKHNIVGDIEDDLGKGVSGILRRRLGTEKDKTNVFESTVLQDVALIEHINKNQAKKSVVEFVSDNAGIEQKGRRRLIEDAETERVDGRIRFKEPKDKRMKLITYLEDGETKGKYINSRIADAFSFDVDGANSHILRFLNKSGNFFKGAYTGLNPGFQLMNMPRDFRNFMKQLPGSSPKAMGNKVKSYLKGIPLSFRQTFMSKVNSAVDYAEKNNMLISFEPGWMLDNADTQLEKKLASVHKDAKKWNNEVEKPIKKITKLARTMIDIGQFVEQIPKFGTVDYLKKEMPELTDKQIAHYARIAGSPAFLRKGKKNMLFEMLAFYGNARKEGYRADIEWARMDPKGFASRQIVGSIGWKIVQLAMVAGWFGDDIRKIIKSASEYDLTNYDVIPVPGTWDKERQQGVIIRMPNSELGRSMGGFAWKMLSPGAPGLEDNISEFLVEMGAGGFGDLPGINPLLGIGADVIDYASGKNIWDKRRGREKIPEYIFKQRAENNEALKALTSDVWSRSTGNMLNLFKPEYIEDKTDLQDFLNMPFIDNTVGRFVKVTGRGIDDRIRERKNKGIAKKSALQMEADNTIKDIFMSGEVDDIDIKKMLDLSNIDPRLGAYMKRKFELGLKKSHRNRFIKSLLRDKSPENMIAVFQEYAEFYKKDLKKESENADVPEAEIIEDNKVAE